MVEGAHALDVGLRPHLKTLKSIDAARIVLAPRHGGIAVSTLREGEHSAAAGFSDNPCAVCLTPDKRGRADLAARPSFGS